MDRLQDVELDVPVSTLACAEASYVETRIWRLLGRCGLSEKLVRTAVAY